MQHCQEDNKQVRDEVGCSVVNLTASIKYGSGWEISLISRLQVQKRRDINGYIQYGFFCEGTPEISPIHAFLLLRAV